MGTPRRDAVVVGSGPNGLTAAIELARQGLSVLVLEAQASIGGGTRTVEWTLPGFLHDACSAVHPMAAASPAFREIGLERAGVEWIHPEAPLAHPLDDGTAVLLERSLEDTGRGLGPDGGNWRDLMAPLLGRQVELFSEILKPLRVPRRPWLLARFGFAGLRSAVGLARGRFQGARARALFAGVAAHSMIRLEAKGSAAFGVTLSLAGHAVGWPFARGGSMRIAEALARRLSELGGEIRVNAPVESMRDVPESKVVLFDLAPRQIARIADGELPYGYRRNLERFRHGPGVFKLDWSLDGPIPWRDPACSRAGTVHVGGSLEEIAAAEAEVSRGGHPERPFVLVAQPSRFDPSRAPAGRHTGWGYCHVPFGSTQDMTERIEAQIERFAPGFRDRILGRHASSTRTIEAHNASMVGGDIGGGANNLLQVLFRPFARFDPYATPNERLFLCSAATPPGGGVHGMCGYWAARSALRRSFGA